METTKPLNELFKFYIYENRYDVFGYPFINICIICEKKERKQIIAMELVSRILYAANKLHFQY